MTKASDVWGGTTTTAEAEAPKPVTTASAVKAQLDAKTDEDVAQQERQMGTSAAKENYSEDVAASLAMFEKGLPKDLKAAFALRKEVEGTPVSGKREEKVKAALLRRVSEHIHEIQQGLPEISIALSADAQVAVNAAQVTAPERRAARIVALKRALDRVFNAEKITPPRCEFPLSVSPRDALLASKAIRENVAAVRAMRIRVELFELEHYGWLNPVDGERELRQQIKDAGINQNLLNELTASLAAMTGPEAYNIRSRFKAERTQLAEDFEKSALILLNKAVEALEGLHAEAVQAETLWLEAVAGLPHEATSVSRRYVNAIAELESHAPSKTFPLPWFGIKDLA